MGLDPGLAAAVSLHRTRGPHIDCQAADATFQLQLAHVLLDGGYDGVATIEEVLPAGDHGLGTVDRLDGELVVVDGVPWRIGADGRAGVLDPATRVPFIVLTTMEAPVRTRLRNASLDDVVAEIDRLFPGGNSVLSVRLEGRFADVLMRSVRAQSPPYRPLAEVIPVDEVRWRFETFDGVLLGFRFPQVDSGDVIGGLHLHGVDVDRTTGGHNYEVSVVDAELSVAVSHEMALAMPDRTMLDLLEMSPELRAVQRLLLRRGALTTEKIASGLGIDRTDVVERLTWLADRGFIEEMTWGLADLGGEPRWRMTLKARGHQSSSRVADLLAGIE